MQAIKAIQYVMREKPAVFAKNEGNRRSVLDKNNTNDNVSEIGSEMSRSFKKAKFTLNKMDSF